MFSFLCLPGAVTSLWWQCQCPSQAGSSTLHLCYSMKTFPGSCWLLLIKAQQNWCTTLPLHCTVYFWIYCSYTHITVLLMHSHAYVQKHLGQIYRRTPPWPLIPSCYLLILMYFSPVALCVSLCLSIHPETMCTFMHLKRNKTKALESSIDDIYFY